MIHTVNTYNTTIEHSGFPITHLARGLVSLLRSNWEACSISCNVVTVYTNTPAKEKLD